MPGPANALNIKFPGYVVFDGVSVFTGRTFQAGTGITLVNDSGIAGDTTISVSGSAVGQTITGNSGGAQSPNLGNWDIITANSTPSFVGSGSTLTLDFSLANFALGSTMPALTTGSLNVGIGPGVFAAITGGDKNVSIGNLSAQAMNNGDDNTCVGYQSGRNITSAVNNSLFGSGAGLNITTGASNCAFGLNALSSFTTGAANAGSNMAIGGNSLGSLATGVNNVAVGITSGGAYTGSESSNICISAFGTLGESNVMRLGTQGSGTGQQLQTHIAGVINTVSGRVVKTTVPGAYPYTTLTTDYVILVDTSAARTINLIAAPVTGTTYRIKDDVGTAAANNITVTPNAGTIDGAASYVINTNWGSIDIVHSGTSWRVV